jgi:MYXO-CTERM domain-containing protein
MNPGSSMCLNVGMMNAAHDECCAQEVCFDIPACCFAVAESKTACLPGEPGGMFTHEFDFVNRTLDTIEHVFIIPPADVTAIPDYIDVPSTPPGGVAHVGPVTFAGAVPGEELCFHVGIHDEEMNQCCSEEICVTVPEPCEREPKVEAKAQDSSAGMACTVHTAPNSTTGALILLGLAALAGWFRRRRSS